MKAIAKQGLTKNILITILLIVLFVALSIEIVIQIPSMVTPYGTMLNAYRKDIYGDIIVYIDSSKYGKLLNYELKAAKVPENLHHIFSFKDDSILEEIQNLPIVSNTLKKTFSFADYRTEISLEDEFGRIQRLAYSGDKKMSGIDLYNANKFFEYNEYFLLPEISDHFEDGILFSQRLIDKLSQDGITLKKGDIISIFSFVKGNIKGTYIGSFIPTDSYSGIEAPESIDDNKGIILANELQQQSINNKVKYKIYEEPPTKISDVYFPGLTDAPFKSYETYENGYNQILIRLKDGVSEKEAIENIQPILDKYKNEELGIEYKVGSSLLNAYYDSQYQIEQAERKNSLIFSVFLMISFFIVGTICLLEFIKEQIPLLSLYHKLGRSIRILFLDFLKQILIIVIIPCIVGTLLGALLLHIGEQGNLMFYWKELWIYIILIMLAIITILAIFASLLFLVKIKKYQKEQII